MKVAIVSSSDVFKSGRIDAGFHILIEPLKERIAELKTKYPNTPDGATHPELAAILADIREFTDNAKAAKLVYEPLSRSRSVSTSFGAREIDAVVKEYPHEVLAYFIANGRSLVEEKLREAEAKVQSSIANIGRVREIVDRHLEPGDDPAESSTTSGPGI